MKALKTTMRAWPPIFLIAVTLSYLTQQVVKLFGIDLPDQAQVEFVRQYAGWNLTFAFIVVQVVLLLPAIEEIVFRWLIWMLPTRLARLGRYSLPLAVLSSCVFTAVHYIAQPFPDSAFIALFFFGLAQCWLYRRTGRLWCAMLNHMLFNLTNLVLLFVLPG